jgi:transposase
MPRERLSMRKIREVLRLKWDRGLSDREIALSCSMGRTTVGEYLERARRAGLTWPLDEALDDEKLEKMLFVYDDRISLGLIRSAPNWAEVHKELKRKGVTLGLLWQEYKADHPEGYQYSRYCDLYRTWLGSVDPVMRQSHKAGEKAFVDYAGQTIPVVDQGSGEILDAQLFLAVLGASNYTYAEATWSQDLFDWIGSHVRTFDFYGGVVEILVPDNLKSGVTRPCRYEPDINASYLEFATHYDVSVIPARVKKPKDKAKVENGVLQAERSILAPLRDRKFFSLGEVNEAIREKLTELNRRPFQKLPGSREEAFEQIDRPALRPLPKTRYEYAEWKRATVGRDYHVEVDGHYYSVPHRFIKLKVDIRITQGIVECFHKGVRVASHLKNSAKGENTTVNEHRPISHQRYLDQTPEVVTATAERIGADVGAVVKGLLEGREHLGIRSCLGVLHLAKEFGEERLCAACKRALALQAVSYKSIRSILKSGLDGAPLQGSIDQSPAIEHENLRGAHYFN